MSRLLALKYPAPCAVCGRELARGASAYLARGMGPKGGAAVRCALCGPWPIELDDYNVVVLSPSSEEGGRGEVRSHRAKRG